MSLYYFAIFIKYTHTHTQAGSGNGGWVAKSTFINLQLTSRFSHSLFVRLEISKELKESMVSGNLLYGQTQGMLDSLLCHKHCPLPSVFSQPFSAPFVDFCSYNPITKYKTLTVKYFLRSSLGNIG